MAAVIKTFAFAAMVGGLVFTGPALGATFVFCSEGNPEGFNPQVSSSTTSSDASGRPIYNRLVEFERGTTNIVPGLAESWTISPDGTVYTFQLRRGVKWHTTSAFTPTRDFNADDVLFSFNRQWKVDHPFHKVSGGTYQYIDATGISALLRSIDKVDDHTVRFTLDAPEAPFLADLGMDWASILSTEYANRMMAAGTPEKLDSDPVGTGPFTRVAYQKDVAIRYRAHPEYWEGRAKIDELVFAITPDAAVRYAKIRAGECHAMPFPNPADLSAMANDPSIMLMSQEGLNVGYWAFNTRRKPFDDIRVRRALNHAVDKQAILDAVFMGSGVAAVNPIPPTIWSYNKLIRDYPYDPVLARQLLAEAGFANGFSIDLWAMPVQRPYNPNARRMAEMIQADLAKIGVKAAIVTYEWAEYLKRTANFEHDTMLLGWSSDNGDPDNFLHSALSCEAIRSGGNRAQWCHKPFDELVVAAKRTSDFAKRSELYARAQEIFKAEAPWLTMAHSMQTMVVRKNVVDFKLSPFGTHVFYGVGLR